MTYRVPVRHAGIGSALKSLVRREHKDVQAIHDMSFSVQEGEVLGLIGPNGAGKTTTLKILSGILHPTGGTVDVLGFVPWKRDYHYLRQIAFIRGSRPLAVPLELTVQDAFELQKRVYDVGLPEFRRNLDELCRMLGLEGLLRRQVRALSLGERMRCGIAWSLVYGPRILYLDEPTLGLDVSAMRIMRQFITEYASRGGVATIVTSHYMADVEFLCNRVVLIDEGQLLFDGSLTDLADSLAPYRLIKVPLPTATEKLRAMAEVYALDDRQITFRVPKSEVLKVVSQLLALDFGHDFTIEEPPLEAVVSQFYDRGKRYDRSV